MFKKIIQVSILSAALSSVAFAQTADKKVAIDGLLQTMNISKMSENMAARMQEDVRNSIPVALEDTLIKDKKLTNDQKKALVPKLDKAIPAMKNKVGTVFASNDFKKSFIAEQTAQYDKSYSLADINALNSFFQSATGKKFLTEQGKIAQGTITNLQNKFMPIAAEELKKIAQQEITNAGK